MIRNLKDKTPVVAASAYVDQSAQVIGDVQIIAAGTLLTEGTRIPARSLVMGRPGKVKRALTDAEVAEIRWYSEVYVNYRMDYMA